MGAIGCIKSQCKLTIEIIEAKRKSTTRKQGRQRQERSQTQLSVFVQSSFVASTKQATPLYQPDWPEILHFTLSQVKLTQQTADKFRKKKRMGISIS